MHRITIQPSTVQLGNPAPGPGAGSRLVAMGLGVAFSAAMGAIVAPWFKVQRGKGAKVAAAGTALASGAGLILGATGVVKYR